MSRGNSLVCSGFKDKENIHPNYPSKGPSCCNSSHKDPSISIASRPSRLHTLNRDSTHQSLKTIFRHFCSSTQDHSRIEPRTFYDLVKLYAAKPELSLPEAIKLCKSNNIYEKSEILQLLNGQELPENNSFTTFRKVLATELGSLKVQLLCEALRSGDNISSEQEIIIQELFREDCPEELSPEAVMQAYHGFKEQMEAQEEELLKLKAKYDKIYSQRIESKLWNDHNRLKISKGLEVRTHKGRLTYEALTMTMRQFLTLEEIAIMFKYFHALESGWLMTILDRAKTLNKNLVISHIFGNRSFSSEPGLTQASSMERILEEQHYQIERLKKDRGQLLEMLTSKDFELQKKNKMLQLLELETSENMKIQKRDLQLQLQRERAEFEHRIQGLLKVNREQKRLTEWYQNELEGVMKATNAGNAMLHVLTDEV